MVDLVRFELTTSSMPWFKNQSLTDNCTRNKRLTRRKFGPRLDLSAGFWGVSGSLDLVGTSFGPHGDAGEYGIKCGILHASRASVIAFENSSQEESPRSYQKIPTISTLRHVVTIGTHHVAQIRHTPRPILLIQRPLEIMVGMGASFCTDLSQHEEFPSPISEDPHGYQRSLKWSDCECAPRGTATPIHWPARTPLSFPMPPIAAFAD